jgi:hypothetical protein
VPQGYSVHFNASRDKPTSSAHMNGIHPHLILDPTLTHSHGSLHSRVIPATSHREVPGAEIRTMDTDTNLVVNKMVSMFRDTLGGLVDVLEGDVEEAWKITTPYRSVQSSRPLSPSASTSSSPSAQTNISSIGELLDEIKGLKRDMKENSDIRIERDAADVQRLRAQMNDLRRTISHRGARRPVSSDVTMNGRNTLFLSHRTPLTQRRHPLAHLLVEDDLPPTESSSSPHISPDAEVASVLTLSSEGSQKSHHLLSPLAGQSSMHPQDDVPLPIKSQRKHRMFFPEHQQN